MAEYKSQTIAFKGCEIRSYRHQMYGGGNADLFAVYKEGHEMEDSFTSIEDAKDYIRDEIRNSYETAGERRRRQIENGRARYGSVSNGDMSHAQTAQYDIMSDGKVVLTEWLNPAKSDNELAQFYQLNAGLKNVTVRKRPGTQKELPAYKNGESVLCECGHSEGQHKGTGYCKVCGCGGMKMSNTGDVYYRGYSITFIAGVDSMPHYWVQSSKGNGLRKFDDMVSAKRFIDDVLSGEWPEFKYL